LESRQLNETCVRQNPNDWTLAIDLMASAIRGHSELADIETTKDQDRLSKAAIWMLAIACVSAGDLGKTTATAIDLKVTFLKTRDYMETRPFRHLAQMQLGDAQKAQLRQIRESVQPSSPLCCPAEVFGSSLARALDQVNRYSDI
jgi:hypothetical protein